MNDYSVPATAPDQTPPRPARGGGSCFLRGCLLVVVILMLIGVIVGGLGWYVTRQAQPFFTHAPVAIPVFAGGEAAFGAVEDKIAAFKQGLAAGQKSTLSLTTEDLNALLAHEPHLSKYRDRIYLSIVGNELIAQTSFPVANDTDLPADQRWYCNARFVLNASYSSGDFAFLLVRFETLGRAPASQFLARTARWYLSAASQGFNRSFHEHPESYGELAPLTAQIHTIVIQDNAIVATSIDHPTPEVPAVANPASAR